MSSINPGTDPIPDGRLDLAERTMTAFAAAVAERTDVGRPVRDEQADGGGRFGYVLPVGGVQVHVRMPGVNVERLHAMGPDAPCIYVGGLPWYWPSAVQMTAGSTSAARGDRSG